MEGILKDACEKIENETLKKACNYVTTTKVYGSIMLWQVLLFMAIGPSLTWPMIAILVFVFVKEVKDAITTIGINGGSSEGATGGDQGSTS